VDELTGLDTRREASRVLERNLEQGGAGAVVAWAEGAVPGYHTLMLELDDALYKAGPDVVVLVEVRRGGH
jgi:hypothetical protein